MQVAQRRLQPALVIRKRQQAVQAIKGVEIGLGFEAAGRPGSLVHDEIEQDASNRRTGGFRRSHNHAGVREEQQARGRLPGHVRERDP